MEFLDYLIDLALHLDVHLLELSRQYGVWLYAILFFVVFCETGLVVTPFLPGDSLLFAVGSLCAIGALELVPAMALLMVAAVLGDTVNYWVGNRIGPTVFLSTNSRVLKKKYLDRTHAFYEKHGGKTIIIARFVPIIRTFAPFVAGIGEMTYRRFFAYNVVGGVVWVFLFVLTGYLFGNIPIVQKNFTLVIVAIILLSLVPGIVEYARHRKSKAITKP